MPGGAILHRPSILLAEDSVASRLLTAALLRGLGCDVDAVGHGGEAVCHAHERRYDMIILDIEMPIMDGIIAARIIRRMLGEADDTRIIALSGYRQEDSVRGAARVAFDAALQKPAGRRELAALLTALRGSSPHDAG